MFYAIKPTTNLRYHVVETSTGNLVSSDLKEPQAKKLCRHLNVGGGFEGFTPDFFLRNVEYAN